MAAFIKNLEILAVEKKMIEKIISEIESMLYNNENETAQRILKELKEICYNINKEEDRIINSKNTAV